MMTAAVVGVVATIALSPAAAVESTQLSLASAQMSNMIEFGQSMAIARSDRTVVLKADLDTQRIWLALASTPDTPLTHPITREPYVIRFGPAADGQLGAIMLDAFNFDGGSTIAFDSTGGFGIQGDATIQFSVMGSATTVATMTVADDGTRERRDRADHREHSNQRRTAQRGQRGPQWPDQWRSRRPGRHRCRWRRNAVVTTDVAHRPARLPASPRLNESHPNPRPFRTLTELYI
jgi:hypothetical protein